VRGQPYGAFALLRRGPRRFAPETTALVTAFADQAALAIENAQLRGAARQAAALQERQKLARELHDSVSQALFGIVLGAQTACDMLADDASPLAEPLQYVLQLAEAGLAEMRALIFELHPERLHTDGLVGALTKQLEALRSRHGLTIEGVFGAEPDASADVKVAAYRIAQEALQNTVRHARPTRVTVRLSTSPEGLHLAVEDDGRGFDPQGAFPGHLGLESMRERAASSGGHLEIDSAPGRGTRVRAWFPPGPAAPAAVGPAPGG
jgi:signal transduction histidine kinase